MDRVNAATKYYFNSLTLVAILNSLISIKMYQFLENLYLSDF